MNYLDRLKQSPSKILKGCEIEQYVGHRHTGEVMPMSARLASDHPRVFSVEPEQRNVEFASIATPSYFELLKDLIERRMILRDEIAQIDPNMTVIPGSSLSLPFDKTFVRSKPEDPYHTHIQERHGLSILTASVHYSIGISADPEELVRICNILRTEASLILALTASSPFLDGQTTGQQSTRWLAFPQVPDYVRAFVDYADYIAWHEQMLDQKHIYNYRHLWCSARPNGDNKPHDINRIEMRIADASTHWELVIAIMAWLELRAESLKRQADLKIEPSDTEAIHFAYENEYTAAVQGLAGQFSDWLYEEESSQYDAIKKRLDETEALSEELQIKELLEPLAVVLDNGNEASQKLAMLSEGLSIEEIMQDWIEESERADLRIATAMQLVDDISLV